MNNQLSILVRDTPNEEVRSFLVDSYDINNKNHNDDCGYDLYVPDTIIIPAKSISYKINFHISTKMTNNNNNVGFMIVPRSSMGSKTPLRLSNSIGIVDAGYRGNIMVIVDNISNMDYKIDKGSRIVQLVAFNGMPIRSELVDELDETIRGEGGLGSTGN